jgi:hypothetical protein
MNNELDQNIVKASGATGTKQDIVNHPPHYTSHPSGIECIQVTQHMNFCLGNAMKYIWRCDDKNDAIEDLEKAIWYINQEIKRRQSCK